MGHGRALARPEILHLAKEHLLPVSRDDWYHRRQDAEGEFFRNMAQQDPRKGAAPSRAFAA